MLWVIFWKGQIEKVGIVPVEKDPKAVPTYRSTHFKWLCYRCSIQSDPFTTAFFTFLFFHSLVVFSGWFLNEMLNTHSSSLVSMSSDRISVQRKPTTTAISSRCTRLKGSCLAASVTFCSGNICLSLPSTSQKNRLAGDSAVEWNKTDERQKQAFDQRQTFHSAFLNTIVFIDKRDLVLISPMKCSVVKKCFIL